MTDQDPHTIGAMRHYGGGFVKALAEAASRADSDNLRRIKEAFPEYWEKYSALTRAEELWTRLKKGRE